ncbi:hypothetical protein KFU94_25515 [Chloroflexi bacterium TSY]|nr:hypothetical protein [Chloroflexi bacterium TSY]
MYSLDKIEHIDLGLNPLPEWGAALKKWLNKHVGPSGWIYLGLVVAMFTLHGVKLLLPLQVNSGQQTSWLLVTITAVLGGVGFVLSSKIGFPEMWDAQIPLRRRLWMPLLWGLGIGTLMVLFDLVQPMGYGLQTRFPDSVPIFALGGLLEEIQIHLFVLPLFIWIISNLALRGRRQTEIFWGVAIIGAVAYWGLQMFGLATMFPEKFTLTLAVQFFVIIVGSITGGAVLFRQGGFLSALIFRYGFYFMWHILWGGGIGLIRYFS